ncbi:unnamed protein product [Clonostachys byssicola]|uniref:RRM domain-containing protein n=1 Tax=Clonostachys byssicola TaxID=160290 RepID=A0A9N9U2Y7_9HYPO|nr:unnamed protein product [Clonostachys byssicola]
MARELRPRKPAVESQKPEGKPAKAAEKPVAKGKRKATEAQPESPIPRKLQKSTKKSLAKEPKEKPSPAKIDRKAWRKTKPSSPPPGLTDSEEEEVDAEEEEVDAEEKEVDALAAELDPEGEGATTDAGLYKPGQPVGKIPDVSQAVQKAAKAASDGEAGIIYVGRIPHGFYEHEMKQYFSQFGTVTQIRLSRNKKTGASKHFAFIEFAEASTAEIVAKTMDNYLLFGHILKCKVLPKEQAHDDIFKGANKRFKKVPWNKIAGKNLEKPLSEASWKKKVTKEQNKRNKSAEVLKKIGYTFEAPEIQAVPPPAPKDLENAESKAIEATPKEEATEKIVEDAPEEEEKPKSISAPKTKVTKPKAKKAAKGKKAKA